MKLVYLVPSSTELPSSVFFIKFIFISHLSQFIHIDIKNPHLDFRFYIYLARIRDECKKRKGRSKSKSTDSKYKENHWRTRVDWVWELAIKKLVSYCVSPLHSYHPPVPTDYQTTLYISTSESRFPPIRGYHKFFTFSRVSLYIYFYYIILYIILYHTVFFLSAFFQILFCII